MNDESAADYAISAYSLKKIYKDASRAAVDNISLKIPKGEFVSIVGKNGAGKSTLIEMFACIQKITSGQLIILGKNAESEWMSVSKKIAFLPQQASLYPHLTVRENLNYFKSLHSENLDTSDVISKMKLGDIINQRVNTLSGGQKQRACLACIMIGRPNLILLDEPSTGLDPNTRNETWKMFHGLKNNDLTVIVSTHDIIEAKTYSDRILFLEEGRVIFNGHPSELRTNTNIIIDDPNGSFDDVFEKTVREGTRLKIVLNDSVELSEAVQRLVKAGYNKDHITIDSGNEIINDEGCME